tara:strand:+ start:250 stop:465 length:216 start_codon:yes stop_codon:yes gene_type:complete
MANDTALSALLGITEEPLQTMSKSEMLLSNLETQQAKTRQEIHLLEEELADKKEYLLKIVGGIETLNELSK